MQAELIDPQAILRLRVLCKLDHARVARLCGLSLAQVRELEEGGHSQFNSRDAVRYIQRNAGVSAETATKVLKSTLTFHKAPKCQPVTA